MAGLPGTGKSTLAGHLAAALRGVVLSKDIVRAALFPAPIGDFSPAQDEIAMTAVYAAARYILEKNPARPLFLDGRTFTKPGQLDPPITLARTFGTLLCVIECICHDEIASARLAADHAARVHPAINRTPDLYLRAKTTAVPLTLPHVTLDTGTLPLEECVRRALGYISLCSVRDPGTSLRPG